MTKVFEVKYKTSFGDYYRMWTNCEKHAMRLLTKCLDCGYFDVSKSEVDWDSRSMHLQTNTHCQRCG